MESLAFNPADPHVMYYQLWRRYIGFMKAWPWSREYFGYEAAKLQAHYVCALAHKLVEEK